jgi:hypothetical protein
LTIPTFRGEDLEHLVEMPAPARLRPVLNASLPDFRGEHRTSPVNLKLICQFCLTMPSDLS